MYQAWPRLFVAPGISQVGRFGSCQSGEHRSNPPEVDVRHPNTNRHNSKHHQKILQDADPSHSPYAADKNEPCQERDGNHHGVGAANAAETRYFHDNSESGELKLQVGYDERDPDHRYKRSQALVAVLHQKEIR